MSDAWMSEPYEPDNEIDRLFTTNESWRGDQHASEDETWRSSLDDEWDDDLYMDEEDPDAWQWDSDTSTDAEPWLFREPNEDDPTA